MRSIPSLVALLFFCVTSCPGNEAGTENWPEFRGPHADGRAVSSVLPMEWSESENVAWKIPIHGMGWSSPVIWGDQIWLTTATEDGKRMFGVCVDRQTGEIVYDLPLIENEMPRLRHATNSYASPTPAVEDGRVYLHFGSYGTVCVDTSTGKRIWERTDFSCNHWRGPGASPIIDGDLLFVPYDGYDVQFIVAMNKLTGETVWKKDRDIDYGTDDGDRKKAYCTCRLIEFEGRRQLISPSAVETISYDPASGDELWRVRHGGMNACTRPLFGHGLIFIATGDAPSSLTAVRPDGSGDVTDSHVSWTLDKSAPKRPSQLLVGDHLFLVNDDGIAACLEPKSGEVIWRHRLGGNFRSSPIYAGGRIYCFDLDGKSHVFAAGEQFKLLATNTLANGCQASPAVSDDSLFVRTTGHLYRIQDAALPP